MKITILLFARLRELLGSEKIEVQLPPETKVSDAPQCLFEDKSEAKKIAPCLLYAINQSYVPADTILHDGDELALIPPVAGG